MEYRRAMNSALMSGSGLGCEVVGKDDEAERASTHGLQKHELQEMERDEQLEARANRALEQGGWNLHRIFNVTISHGTAKLTGVTTWYYHKQLAQEFVGRVEGVRSIQNDIVVSY